MFDKCLHEELTPRERQALALESGPMRRIAISERAVIALCNRVLGDEPGGPGPTGLQQPPVVVGLDRRADAA